MIEKHGYTAGNIYDKNRDGIFVHRCGPHIFYTLKKEIRRYINQFGMLNHFVNNPIADYRGKLYNLPFNMNIFYQLWGTVTPEQVTQRLEGECVMYLYIPRNPEEQMPSPVGSDIYEKLIKGYTEKQWGQACNKLPVFIIRRLPLRFTYDNNYFNDPHQGAPITGYTVPVEKMLQNSEVHPHTDYFQDRLTFNRIVKRVIYTGVIDRYFDYGFGQFIYRSLWFESSCYGSPNYQGVAIMNFTDREAPYTRSIEHKYFQFGEQPHTIVTWEYSLAWKPGQEPCYPVNDSKNQQIYEYYSQLAECEGSVVFCGRLAQYRYYDMDQVIEAAPNRVTVEPELWDGGGAMPLISVTMRVYFNKSEAAPLGRVVRSVLGQSLSDFDLLIYNDGSDASAKELLDRMAEADARIKLVRQEGAITLPRKLNLCPSHAMGCFIARMDDNDFSHPQRLGRQYEYLVRHPEISFVGCNVNRIFDTDMVIPAILPEFLQPQDFSFVVSYIHPALLFRREVLEAAGGCSEKKHCLLCEDYDLLLRLYYPGFKGSNLQAPLSDYSMVGAKEECRNYRFRINEATVRFIWFKRLGMLSQALPYVVKLLTAGLLPLSLFNYLRQKREARKKRDLLRQLLLF